MDYTQLSDLVDQNIATEEQKKLYSELLKIGETIKKRDVFVIEEEDFKSTTIGIVDMDRLYVFLKDIHTNNYLKYMVQGVYID